MRSREKLTLEEKVALALDLIKRERSLEEIRTYYRVSHTTAYKVRNTFLEGGRAALLNEKKEARRGNGELEERLRALEQLLRAEIVDRESRPPRPSRASGGNGNGASARKR